MIDIISWCATGLSLFGQVLINNKKKAAFPVWIISNLLWIVVNIIGTFNTANVVMYIVYTVMNFAGLYNWIRTDKRNNV